MRHLKMFIFAAVLISTWVGQINLEVIHASAASAGGTVSSLNSTCTDSGNDFSGTVTVDSYSSNPNSVCTGRVTSTGSVASGSSHYDSGNGTFLSSTSTRGYSIEFQPYNGSSSSATAINASLQTACKVLEEAKTSGLEVMVSGDIFNCTVSGSGTLGSSGNSRKIRATYIAIGEETTGYTHASFGEFSTGDVVLEADCSVFEYQVYSNQVDNQCSANLLNADEEYFNGIVTVNTAAMPAAIIRCNALLDSYVNSLTVDIQGVVESTAMDYRWDPEAADVTINRVQ